MVFHGDSMVIENGDCSCWLNGGSGDDLVVSWFNYDLTVVEW